jgi:hypothetical protein
MSAVIFAISITNCLKMLLKDVHSVGYCNRTKDSNKNEKAAQTDIENCVNVGSGDYFECKKKIWETDQEDKNQLGD